jgi:hypothetical protein
MFWEFHKTTNPRVEAVAHKTNGNDIVRTLQFANPTLLGSWAFCMNLDINRELHQHTLVGPKKK